MTPQRIGLISSAVPLTFGGYRFIVEWLEENLRDRGHSVETIYIPTTDDPDSIIEQMAAFRMMDLDPHFDRVITFRPPSHLVKHRRKVCWFIHHIRLFYDLWDSEYSDLPNTAQTRALRDTIRRADTTALSDAHRLFTNSRVVAERLRRFNSLEGEVLYPPVMHPEAFRTEAYGDEIVCVCRMQGHKRQHLLVEAMRYVQTAVRLRLCGLAGNLAYVDELERTIAQHGLAERVTIEHRWISEEEKADRLASSLAAAYIPFDEDSYGYPTLEAAHAKRCTVTVGDSGGVPEFVEQGRNGLIVEPQPEALAGAFDRLYRDRNDTIRMGEAAEARVRELGINWDAVIARLLS
jgi:glycosyltransferase involved in cell wall biosynthesis